MRTAWRFITGSGYQLEREVRGERREVAAVGGRHTRQVERTGGCVTMAASTNPSERSSNCRLMSAMRAYA